MSKLLDDLVATHGEEAVKTAIEGLIYAQKSEDWKIAGSNYLHEKCNFSSIHDQKEPITFGVLGIIMSKYNM